jgi:hypothetical protein
MAERVNRRAHGAAAVESLERRTLFAAGATVTVVSSSLAEASTDEPLKGSAVVSVTNSGTVTLTSPYGIQIFASTVPLGVGTIDVRSLPVGDVYVHSAIAPGQTVTYTIKGKLDHQGELEATTYNVYAEFRDAFLVGANNEIGFYAASGAGPTLTVPPPLISLSATQAISKLSGTVTAGTATAGIDKVKVKNAGKDPSAGSITVTVYLSPDGTVASGTALQSVEVSPHIGHGGSTVVSVPLDSIPAVSAGTYELVATVEDPNGVTTTSAASSPLTVAAAGAAAPVAFSVALASVAPQAGADLVTEEVSLVRLSPALTFTNVSGAKVSEPVTLTYYFSLLPTFAVDSAIKITSNTFTLKLGAKGKSSAKFKLTTNVPLGHADAGLTDTPLYYSVVATDAAGNSTTATYATPINFDL